MDYRKTAQEIYDHIGKKENIISAAHCATRLRLVISDNSKADKEYVENIEGVKGVFFAQGQMQIILGTGIVNKVYDEFIRIAGVSESSKEELKKVAASRANPVQRLIKTLGDIFVPIIPAIVASGFLMGIMEALNFMVNNGFLNIDTSGSIYTFAQLFSNTAYTFLPILIAYSGAKVFGANPYLGAVIGMIMIHPNLQNAWTVATEGVKATQKVWFGLYSIDMVGVILPKIDSNTISREVAGISDILTKKGYQLILANTNNSVEEELKYLSLFRDNQVDGVIFIATILTKQHREMMKGFKVPIVLLGQQLDGYPCIFQDDYKAAVNLTEQMVKTGKKFGYITVTDKDEAVGRQRKSGVEKVLGENQITLESGCVKCGNFTLESGYEKAKELFTEHPDVDTLICATDTMAVGAANWLKENGYQIPQQVQIAGMGDSFLGKIIEPKLTTVHFFYKTSGMESAKVLVDLIESKETSSVHKEIKMGCKVVLRESHRNI